MTSSFPPETDRPENVPRGVPPAPPIARPITAREFAPGAPLDPMLLRGIGRKGVGADLLVFLGLILVAVGAVLAGQKIAGLLSAPDLPGDRETDHRALELGISVALGALAVALAVLITRRRGLKLDSLGLTARRLWIDLPLGLVTTGASFAVIYVVSLTITVVWPAGREELLKNAQRVREHMPEMELLTLAALAVFVGIWEEVVFRGFLLARVRRLIGSWVAAAVLTSALFAVLHLGMQTPVFVIPLFFLSVLFSAVTIWRRSLIPAMVGHFIFDLIQLLVITRQLPGLE